MIVVDASIGVKWFFTEADSGQAERLLDARKAQILVPDLFVMEVAATLVRGANVIKPTLVEAQSALDRLMALFESEALESVRISPAHTVAAARMAIDMGHPIKDCIYLILATERGLPLVTSDMRFAEKAAHYYPRIVTLSDFTP